MNIQELIKGVIVGIAKIIPGLSGAVLMISFNLYDRAIQAITNFFENPKKNFFFLLNLGLGIFIGIVLFSKIISYFLTNYYLYTTMLFLGLIIGGIPVIRHNMKQNKFTYFLSLLAFFFMLLLTFNGTATNYVLKNNIIDALVFFFSGFLEALGTVLPGISSTALLMLVGVYDYYIVILGNVLEVTNLSNTLYFLVPFSLGMFVGIIIISMLVNFLFKYYKEKTFSIIFGISLATVLTLLIRLFPYLTNFSSIVISVIMIIIGYFLTNKLTV